MGTIKGAPEVKKAEKQWGLVGKIKRVAKVYKVDTAKNVDKIYRSMGGTRSTRDGGTR